MKEEYTTAENDKGKVIGVLSGINELDESCKGAKKGELWMHAAFPGELKCVAGDATVFDHATGRVRTVREMFESVALPIVTALDREGETHKLVQAQTSHLVENGVRDVYELTLASGRSLGASNNHKVFTPKGWQQLDVLSVGDWVAVPSIMRAEPPRAFTDSEVKAVGYLIGDGAVDYYITLTNSCEAVREDFKDCLRDFGLQEGAADYITPNFTENFPEDRAPFIRVSHSSGLGSAAVPTSSLRTLLEELGVWGCTSYTKQVPQAFLGLPDDQVTLFLGALWATDGSCHTGDHEREDRESLCSRNDISYGSVSRPLCLGIQALLLRLGIQSTVTTVQTTYREEPYTFYCVRVVTNPSKRIFVERIQVVGKEDRFAELQRRLPSTDNRPFPTAFIPEGMKIRWVGANGERWRYATNTKNRPSAQADTLRLFATDPTVAKALDGDLAWEQVASVRLRGQEMTYDLSVPGHHSFVVNDIVTHNTMLASNWCYNAVTRFKKNVVYVSFEMPRDQIRRNIYTIHTSNARFLNQGYQGIDYRSIRDGNMTKAEKEFYFDCVIPDFTTNPTYGTFEVVTPDREWTMDDVRSEIELLHKEFEVGLVVLDHGQWIEAKKTKKNKDYTIELNSVITDAKRLALNFDHNSGIPVLMLFQINRTGKTDADKNEGVYKMNALTYANNCLIDGTMVSTEYGLIPISAVTTGTRVWSSCGWKSVLANYANGVRPVVEIRTDRGLVISATADHRFRTLGSNGVQWTAAVDLVGSYVLGSTNVPVEGRATVLPKVEFHPYEHLERAGVSIQAPEVLDKNLAYLLGAHAGDGSLSSGHVGFCGHKSEKAVLARLQTSFKAAFNQDLALWYAKATKTFYLDIGSQPLVRWFRAIGSDRGETGIPPCILESSTECQREFLRGLWDTDGHINTQGVLSLGQKASKRKTLEDMQLVLLCLGIDSSILHKVEKLNGKEYPQEVLILRSRRGRELFASLVGFTEPHKQRRLEHFVNKFAGSDRRASLEKWPVAGIYRRMLLKHGWFTTKGAEQIKLLNLFLGPSKTLRLSTIADHLYGSHGGNETRKAYSLAQTLVRKKLLGRTARGEYTGSVENERFYFPRKCNVALHKTKRHQLVSRGAIEAALETLAMRGVADPDAELLTRLLQNVVPQRVVSVTPAGEGQVYDLEVTGDHEYAAGGLLVHNCEKTADVITTTYLNTDMRAAGMTKFTNLKNRDNPLFDPFSANVNFGWRRISSGKRMEPQGFSVDHHSSYLGATEQV